MVFPLGLQSMNLSIIQVRVFPNIHRWNHFDSVRCMFYYQKSRVDESGKFLRCGENTLFHGARYLYACEHKRLICANVGKKNPNKMQEWKKEGNSKIFKLRFATSTYTLASIFRIGYLIFTWIEVLAPFNWITRMGKSDT